MSETNPKFEYRNSKFRFLESRSPAESKSVTNSKSEDLNSKPIVMMTFPAERDGANLSAEAERRRKALTSGQHPSTAKRGFFIRLRPDYRRDFGGFRMTPTFFCRVERRISHLGCHPDELV